MNRPLATYIVYHPQNHKGIEYARAIYSTFSRDVHQPLERGIGIPTYFISDCNNLVQQIDWSDSEQTGVIVLIDDNMILDEQGENWSKAVSELHYYCENKKKSTFFLPVALSAYVDNFSDTINMTNRLNLYECCSDNKLTELLLQVAFKLTARLYISDQVLSVDNERELPVKIFISHARKGGEGLAKQFKRVIDQLTMGLEAYIDVRNIGKGHNFEAEITNAISQSIFLVINTDDYSNREWCAKEILQAKEFNCPIIVVEATRQYIRRTFPYLGNAHSIRLKVADVTGGYNIDEIIKHVLLEALRYKYHYQLNREILKQEGEENYKSLALPPELLTITQGDRQNILYPDPPLGNRELDVLKRTDSEIEFITPVLYASNHEQQDTFLTGKCIGVSISENTEIGEDGIYHFFDHVHLEDVLVELSRYLLACGSRIAYGGNIDYSSSLNFTTILTDLVAAYVKEYKGMKDPAINHVCYPISDRLRKNIALRTKFKGMIDFKLYGNPLETDFTELKTGEGAICMTDMRKKMANYNDVQIFVGGKLSGYKGLTPGLLEEAYWMLKNERPVFLLGAFGGCTSEVIKMMTIGEGKRLKEEDYRNRQDENWQERYHIYSTYSQHLWLEKSDDVSQRVDYELFCQFFHDYWLEHGENLPNGLSKEENWRLFESKNIIEIVQLILKGLNNLFNGK